MSARFGSRYNLLLTRDPHKWVPGNEFARQLVLFGATWEDIARLGSLRAEQTQPDDIKLLTRYILLEIFALSEVLERLQVLAFGPGAEPARPELLDDLRTAFRRYNQQLDVFRRLMTDVRGQIVAHRPDLEPDRFYELWRRTHSFDLSKLLGTVRPLFDLLRDFGLDVWTRRGEDGSRHVAFPFRMSGDEPGQQ